MTIKKVMTAHQIIEDFKELKYFDNEVSKLHFNMGKIIGKIEKRLDKHDEIINKLEKLEDPMKNFYERIFECERKIAHFEMRLDLKKD